jgi:hypothetical protein
MGRYRNFRPVNEGPLPTPTTIAKEIIQAIDQADYCELRGFTSVIGPICPECGLLSEQRPLLVKTRITCEGCDAKYYVRCGQLNGKSIWTTLRNV